MPYGCGSLRNVNPQALSSSRRHRQRQVKPSPFAKLKKVSGRLRRIFNLPWEAWDSESHHPRLLVVDDEQSIRFFMREYFGLYGFTVDTAREVGEAEKLIEKTDYAVIILDLRLGTTVHDGLKVLKGVHSRSPKTRVVVLTAYGSDEMEDEARRCGADAFLRKPKRLSQVAQVVHGLIESPPKQAAKSA
jgi:DNA-binding NtrC family response regulator